MAVEPRAGTVGPRELKTERYATAFEFSRALRWVETRVVLNSVDAAIMRASAAIA